MLTTSQTDIDRILTALDAYRGTHPPALSLPPESYRSPELWELERQKIFHRSWWLVAHADQLAETGDYVAVSIAGEQIVVTRAADGELYALSPICRHRLMPLVKDGAGHTDSFTCQYHLWKYGLDGRLKGAPYMGGNKEFEAEQCRLPGFAVADWNGFVWVNLDANAAPIGDHLDLAAPQFDNYRLGEMVQVDSWSMPWQVNWKLVMENGHENYHVIGLHRETLEPFMPGGGDLHVETYSPWVLHARIPFTLPLPSDTLALSDIQQRHGMLLMTFPTGAFIALSDRVVWLSILPQTVDRVQVVGGVLTTPELARDSAEVELTQQAVTAMINDEDRVGLEAVQRGVTSRYAQRGHLSPKESPGILAFYRNLATALLDDNPWPGSR
ncbi:aromatic ring-hydroxylating dioxygenase subunit alpha [Nocardia sp. 2]|uniref:Aromatic ring-hydroxylating dioxygenase subunit alpha n=1 Tax=Nocardia acididurans TaxID=2802282 RepID=A0ABS1MIQ3_9NOCA|nr:aromatic ring-hydroxylating dioxygenase subunit alpha [Nocardia acididurans]MBL1079118.1 aromatic ring-hydroxylating dioxygenase subunit alpha [Nocardia acididurans]